MIHGRIASQLNEILNGTARLPEWRTYGRTVLCQKDAANSIAVDTTASVTCRPKKRRENAAAHDFVSLRRA